MVGEGDLVLGRGEGVVGGPEGGELGKGSREVVVIECLGSALVE